MTELVNILFIPKLPFMVIFSLLATNYQTYDFTNMFISLWGYQIEFINIIPNI